MGSEMVMSAGVAYLSWIIPRRSGGSMACYTALGLRVHRSWVTTAAMGTGSYVTARTKMWLEYLGI